MRGSFGAASEQAGEHAAAERHLRKSLELNPDFAPAQNYLGYLLAVFALDPRNDLRNEKRSQPKCSLCLMGEETVLAAGKHSFRDIHVIF